MTNYIGLPLKMKSKKKTVSPVPKRFFLPQLFCLFVLSRAADAQQSTPQQSTVQPLTPPVESTSQLIMPNEFQVFAPRPAATAPGPYEPFQWDQFVIRPHADYQYMYAQGILASPGNPQNTTIQLISPGVLINLGPHWALDYTATIGLYSNTNFGREFNNAINLTGQTVFGDWIFGFAQGVNLSTSPLIETGAQTSQNNYNTTATGHHENSQYISMDLSLTQNLERSEDGFENSSTWSTMDWLNYTPQSHFNIGIGPGIGYTHAEFGPDSFYQQAQARVNWRATGKLSFQLSGGVQETEFLGNDAAGNLFSPIYGGSIQYQPFSNTGISLFANRSVSPSLFVGQYTDAETLGFSVSQRFLGQFFASLGGSYGKTRYVSSTTSTIAGREDNFYDLSARLSHSFLKRGSVAAFYQYSQDKSSIAEFSFTSNQFGVEVNYAF